MSCSICHSHAVSAFPADVRFYVNGSRAISAPPISPGPKVEVCLHCGHAQFDVPAAWLSSGWLHPFALASPPATEAAAA